jgi:hypothetical protein
MGIRHERVARFPGGNAGHLPSREGHAWATMTGQSAKGMARWDSAYDTMGLIPSCVPRERQRGMGALLRLFLLIWQEVRLMSNPCNQLYAWGLRKGPSATRDTNGVCAGMPTPCTGLRSTWPEGRAPLHWGISLVEEYVEIPRSIAALASLPYAVKSAWYAMRGRRARR